MPSTKPDPDLSKGATEEGAHDHNGNAGLHEQLGHRDQEPMLKGADSDYPEPGGSPEHSGESDATVRQKTA